MISDNNGRAGASVAIMTWYSYRNYGTALQAVALNRQIASFGYIPFDVAYNPALGASTHEPGKRSIPDRIMGRVNRAFGGISVTGGQREALFDDFLGEHLPLTSSVSRKVDLHELNGAFDAFVCGSDQVWSPRSFDSSYYLDFVDDASRIVAYAPSFGCETLEPFAASGEICRLLRRFQHIGVRESSGAAIVEGCTGHRPPVVLDPTLLLSANDWDELSKPMNEETPYCLVYFLGTDLGNWRAARAIARARGLRMVVIPVFERDLKSREAPSCTVGPAEFLWLIAHAEVVCTDSFHGMVFSSIFRRDFVAFERFDPRSRDSQNTRVYNFLQMAGAESALLPRSRMADWREYVGRAVDYVEVSARIEQRKSESLDYLSAALASAVSAGGGAA